MIIFYTDSIGHYRFRVVAGEKRIHFSRGYETREERQEGVNELKGALKEGVENESD